VVFTEVNAADHAGFHEKLEGPVDGSARDLEAFLLHFEKELVGFEVVVRREDLADERRTLGGELQSLAGQEMLEAVDFALEWRHAFTLFETESQLRRGL